MSRQFPLTLTASPQIVPISGGDLGFHKIFIGFSAAPTSGFVSVEKRVIGALDWLPINGGENVPIVAGQAVIYTDGVIAALRVTFIALDGGTAPILWLSSQPTAWPPLNMATDGGTGPSARYRVDVGQTGFFARRMWSLSYEFASANPINTTPLVFRVTVPVNFIVHAHSLSVDQGGLSLRTYAESQGTPGGTFGPAHPLASENTMDEEPAYAFQADIDSGGTFTPTGGAVPITTLRVRTSGATAQQTSVGGAAVSEKGRAAGVYYAVLSRMSGVSGDCTGVYNLVVEERPNGSQMPFPT